MEENGLSRDPDFVQFNFPEVGYSKFSLKIKFIEHSFHELRPHIYIQIKFPSSNTFVFKKKKKKKNHYRESLLVRSTIFSQNFVKFKNVFLCQLESFKF